MSILTNIKSLFRIDKLYNHLKQLDMKQVGTILLKNWKTGLAGIAMVIVGILAQNGAIPQADVALIQSILAGLGFVAAKDGNVSGQ